MQFLIGSKQEFIDFINNIKKEDNIAILTHTDLDGIASAIFFEEILKSRKLKTCLIKFVDYKNDILVKLKPIFKKEKISKIFILDMAIDSLAFEDFESLRKEIPIFVIDHHPMNPELDNFKNIIKAESHNCATQVVHEIGKNLTDFKEKNWLLIPTMISEFSYKNQENMEFIQSIYPKITEENILNSEPGKVCGIINYALIYYNDSMKKIYDIVCNGNLKVLEKCHKIIDTEIKKELENFVKNGELYENKKLYFYLFKPKHRIKSMISTELSLKKPDYSFVLITQEGKDKNYLNASARNQSKNQDMNQLMKKAIHGLTNANAGGHIPAAGARFMKKDLKKFKENLLR